MLKYDLQKYRICLMECQTDTHLDQIWYPWRLGPTWLLVVEHIEYISYSIRGDRLAKLGPYYSPNENSGTFFYISIIIGSTFRYRCQSGLLKMDRIFSCGANLVLIRSNLKPKYRYLRRAQSVSDWRQMEQIGTFSDQKCLPRKKKCTGIWS